MSIPMPTSLLLYRMDVTVGRIAALENKCFNEYHKTQ